MENARSRGQARGGNFHGPELERLRRWDGSARRARRERGKFARPFHPMMSRASSPGVDRVLDGPARGTRRPCNKRGARANGRDEKKEQSPPFSFNYDPYISPERGKVRAANRVWKHTRGVVSAHPWGIEPAQEHKMHDISMATCLDLLDGKAPA
jgi:hypothetical protein